VKETEEELTSLRKKVEQFPSELEKAIKNTEKHISESIETKYKFEKELLAKETDGELKLREQTITTLEAKIKEQENLIKQLSQKADSSEKTVKDIAIKALDTASKIPVITKEMKQGE
jgi:predicted RNase H-like nuclease (RuvC/YqgF family)